MRRFAILVMLALELAVSGCANNNPHTTAYTSTTGNWEAQLISPTAGPASLLNFVIAFNVTNSGPLNITGFAFFNQGSCFVTALNGQNTTGSASFTTATTGQVTGTLNLKITSKALGSVLTLTSLPDGLTGTSNGTTTTTGTLSNGMVVGTWTLTPGAQTSGCNAVTQGDQATFIMCQNGVSQSGTCGTTPAAAAEKPDLPTGRN